MTPEQTLDLWTRQYDELQTRLKAGRPRRTIRSRLYSHSR